MHILLTGGTGLMGRRLCARWRQAGHRLTVFSRRPQQVESLCGVGVRGIDRFDEYGDQPLDAVVNLARRADRGQTLEPQAQGAAVGKPGTPYRAPGGMAGRS